MAASPVVSVIMPVHNAGELLAPAIASVLAQTHTNLELLAIDDASSDGSRAVLEEFAARDPRLRLIVFPANCRAPVARNTALGQARGAFIAFQNHDDRAAPERLARQLQFLHDHPEHGAVVSAVDYSDPQGRPVGSPWAADGNQISLRWMALMENPFHISSLLVRAPLFHGETGLRFDPTLTHRSDYGFHCELLRAASIGVIPDVLVHYILHPGSVSRMHGETMQRQGDRVAHRAIQHELPGHSLTLEEVSEMRGILLHLPGGFSRTIAATKRAWDRYLELLSAFRARHGLDASNSLPAPRLPIS